MTDLVEACDGTTRAGAGLGLLAGTAIAIWAAVKYIEPAFEKTNGFNRQGAQAITALVALGGEVEAGMAGGAMAGASNYCRLCFCSDCLLRHGLLKNIFVSF